MSAPYVSVYSVRKDLEMESRYKQLNILNLSEVEQELDTLLEIVNLDTIDDQTFEYLTSLTKLAKALGSTRSW